jgi:threonine dehydrogenase-like Zn-dependent dehydrogenase
MQSILYVPVLQDGKLKPAAVTSHIMPLKDASKGYEIFNSKRECSLCQVHNTGCVP